MGQKPTLIKIGLASFKSTATDNPSIHSNHWLLFHQYLILILMEQLFKEALNYIKSLPADCISILTQLPTDRKLTMKLNSNSTLSSNRQLQGPIRLKLQANLKLWSAINGTNGKNSEIWAKKKPWKFTLRLWPRNHRIGTRKLNCEVWVIIKMIKMN